MNQMKHNQLLNIQTEVQAMLEDERNDLNTSSQWLALDISEKLVQLVKRHTEKRGLEEQGIK